MPFMPQLKAYKWTIVLVLAIVLFVSGVYVGSKYTHAIEENKALVKESEARQNADSLRKKSDRLAKELAVESAKKKTEIKYITRYVEREVVRKLYEDPERDLYCALGAGDVGLLNATRIGRMPAAASGTSGTPGTAPVNPSGETEGARLSTIIQSDIDLARVCGEISTNYNALISWHEKLKHE